MNLQAEYPGRDSTSPGPKMANWQTLEFKVLIMWRLHLIHRYGEMR